MEPEGSLPHLKLPATCPYPEPDNSSPFPPFRPILILSSQLCLRLPSGLFPAGFPTKNPVYNPPLLRICYLPRPSHSRFAHLNDTWWGVHITAGCQI